MKKGLLIISLICCICFIACDKKNEVIDLKEEIDEQSKNIIESVKKYEEDYFFTYKFYSIINNKITDWIGFEYDISEYNINDGVIAKNSDGDIYLSLENEEYCAFKDFGSAEILIYPIKEKSKCHKTHIIDENLITYISGLDNVEKSNYKFGNISKNNVLLFANTNLVDSFNCSYRWYRNGIEIENSNTQSYEIDLSYDDAFYSVEVTTPEGLSVKSESVHVVITK